MSERCAHVRVNGARCTMPALKDSNLCYQHHQRRLLRALKPMPPDYWCQTPLVAFVEMEDLRGILYNLNATADAFARHAIDYRQVSAINRLMQTCLQTVHKMKRLEEEVSPEEIVRAAHFDIRGEGVAEPEPKPEPERESELDPLPESSVAAAGSVVESISAASDPEAEPMHCQALAPGSQLSSLLPTHAKPPSRKQRVFKHLQNQKITGAVRAEQHLSQAIHLRRHLRQNIVQAALEDEYLQFIVRMRTSPKRNLRIGMLARQLGVRPHVSRVA